MPEILLILGLFLIFVFNQKPKQVATAPAVEPNDLLTVLDNVLALTRGVADRVTGVINSGTSKGRSEGQTFQPQDPGDTVAANPDNANQIAAGKSAVTSGAITLNALRASSPSRRGFKSVAPSNVKPRSQRMVPVPYSPFARTSSIDRIKSVLG